MALSTFAKVAIGAGVVLAIVTVASGSNGKPGKQGGKQPQRTPTTPPGPPPTSDGAERANDEGRTWGTFFANRNEKKHWELKVLSVAASPTDDAIGTGEVIVDVYETIVGEPQWEWQGQVCGGARWRLKMVKGHLQSWSVISSLACATVRPFAHVLLQKMTWAQIGSNILLVVDTASGINKLSPDQIASSKFGGTGAYYDKSGDAEWDNSNVDSGYVTLDAAWVFNPS